MNDLNKRLNYFDHQFLRAGDFLQEQAYHIDRRRRHTSGFHTPGIVEGLVVREQQPAVPNRLDVTKGWAVDDIGRELVLTEDRKNVDVSGGDGGLYLVYRETLTDPSTDPGITGSTRVDEEPELFYIISGQPNPPVNLTAMPSSTGGGLATGIYYYRVTAITPQGETIASSEVNAPVNGPNGSVTLGWNPVPGATAYRVYRGTTPGAEDSYQTSNTTSFVDAGAAGTPGRPPEVAPPHAVLLAFVTGGVPSSPGPAVGMKGDDTVLSQHIREADNLPGYPPANNDPQNPNRGSGVKTDHIQKDAVTTPKIADDAVTNAKIADNAVQTPQIADDAVTNAKIADNAVQTPQIADDAVTQTELANGSVSLEELKANVVAYGSIAVPATGWTWIHLGPTPIASPQRVFLVPRITNVQPASTGAQIDVAFRTLAFGTNLHRYIVLENKPLAGQAPVASTVDVIVADLLPT